MTKRILSALRRCRVCAASIFITYLISALVGILMSHNGVEFALSQRDKIVGAAVNNDKASINYQSGNNFTAAIFDFSGNLFYAAIPQTVMGLGVVLPFVSVSYQGWVGGIVSVDNAHHTRFKNFKSTFYYFFVMFLQFLPFSLSIGAGVECGLEAYKYNSQISWKLWQFRIPKESLMNVGYVYLVSIPLFFIASCYEFLSPWNL